MKNEALEKLKVLRAEIPLIKPRPGFKARYYADAIINLPEDRWQEELNKVPEEHRALTTEHVDSFKQMKHGMVMAHADRIMTKETILQRRHELSKVPLPLKADVEAEVKRRFETRRSK